MGEGGLADFPTCPLAVFVTLTCAFRYGREDLDVLGLSFRKDLFVASWQAFPPAEEAPEPLTRLQERLLRKLGAHAHPFSFIVSDLPPPPQTTLCGSEPMACLSQREPPPGEGGAFPVQTSFLLFPTPSC